MSTSDVSTGRQAILLRSQAVPVAAPPHPAPDAASARRDRLVNGPILRTMLSLAAPTMIGSLATMTAGIMQVHFIGLLGVDALAGITLAFPFLSLMQIVASGGIGAGVASAVARSLGAGRRADAEALMLNTLVLAVGFGILFATAALPLGPMLYRLLGGSGAVLAASVAYSSWIFGTSVFLWILSLLINALIGSGNTTVPQAFAASALIVVPLSPALMFGWGPLPRLGISGGGMAFACYYILAATALLLYLRSQRAPLRLPLDLRLVEWRLLREIMRVGGLAALSSAIPTLSISLITAAVARFGVEAIAGYGIAVRTDYLLLPLYLGLSAGVLPMVGTNVGAGQIARARRIAWTGAAVSAGIGGLAGLLLMLSPQSWLDLFSDDPGVIAAGSLYLRIVAIQFPLSAIAIVLSAAAQGAARPLWPLAAITTRLIAAAGGAWFVVVIVGGRLETLFLMLAVASVLSCGVMTAGQLSGRTIPDQP